MLPLTSISLNAVPPNELASATGIQNFVRTVSIGIATAVALTIWGNAQQQAHSNIAGTLQPDEVMGKLGGAGFSPDAALRVIANLVDREAVTVAVDHIFFITAGVFFLCSLVIWLAPRPKPAVVQGSGK
jgi:DHA2 family multidrug resistance protein